MEITYLLHSVCQADHYSGLSSNRDAANPTAALKINIQRRTIDVGFVSRISLLYTEFSPGHTARKNTTLNAAESC